MLIPVDSPDLIGRIARQLRRKQGMRQDDLGAMIGISHVTMREIEKGGLTVQLGSVLALLEELGVKLVLDVPESMAVLLDGDVERASSNPD